jgi:hypothetical protein
MTFLGMKVVKGEPFGDDIWICSNCDAVFLSDELHFCTPGQGSVTMKIVDAEAALS